MVCDRMRLWRLNVLAICLLGGVIAISGCTQPLFVSSDWKRVYENATLPPVLETSPETVLKPIAPAAPTPATVLDPDRPARYVTLSLAIAMALENGTIGSESVRALGIAID